MRKYDGQNSQTITGLIAAEGNTGEFITQQQYIDFIVAHTPSLTPAEIIASLRAQAIDELNTGTQPMTKLQRAVLLVTLDEVNLIRSLLVPSQAPRTVQQFRNAVQNKITSGAAD